MNSTTRKPGNTDADLLTRFVRDEDRDALTEIIRRYEKLVWSICHRALRNPSDVEDAFQITFLTLTTNAAKIRKRKSLSNWLFGVARRTSLNIRRQRANLLLEDNAALIDESQTKLDAIAQQHEIDLVDQQLNALPIRQRTPLIMKYFSGMSAQQIADQLNLTVSAVEGRLRRGRAQLKLSLRRAGLPSGRSDEAHLHQTTLLGSGLLNFVSDPSRISLTASNCIASAAGNVASAITNISYGAKLMMCKTFCVLSIGLMMSTTLWLHPVQNSSGSIALHSIATTSNSTENASAVSVQQESVDPNCCDLCDTVCQSCCGDNCPGILAIEAAHEHLLGTRSCIVECAGEFASWFHAADDG